jgi:hypothetical protein
VHLYCLFVVFKPFLESAPCTNREGAVLRFGKLLDERYNHTEKRNAFNEGGRDQHGSSNFARCFRLTRNGIHRVTADLSDADAGADYGETCTNY